MGTSLPIFYILIKQFLMKLIRGSDLFQIIPMILGDAFENIRKGIFFYIIPSKLIADINNIPVFHFGVIKCNCNVAVP